MVDLGRLRGAAGMAGALRAADVAVFPNRCEGGSNLVAMEAAALGVPTVLAHNTGQADLARILGAAPVVLRSEKRQGAEGGDAGGAPSGATSEKRVPGLPPGFTGCLALCSQGGFVADQAGARRGWGEADPSKVADALEAVYRAGDRGDLAAKAARDHAARVMRREFGWDKAVASLVRLVEIKAAERAAE